jgi:DNA-directed RNA polymerase specialized sigma24 family protein
MRGLSSPEHSAAALVAGHFQKPDTAIPGLVAQESGSHQDDSTVVRRRPKVMQRCLGPDEIVELTEAYWAGMPVRDIAAQFGVGRGTVSAHIRRQDQRRRHPALDPEEADLAIRLYGTGSSLLTVAQQLGVSTGTVRRVLLSGGLVLRDSHGRERR